MLHFSVMDSMESSEKRRKYLAWAILVCIIKLLIVMPYVFLIFKGDCIFVSAESVEIKIHGKMQFLKIGC